jgi:broad specificity phosphatase PhoE
MPMKCKHVQKSAIVSVDFGIVYVIVTHGMAMRMFCMRYLLWTVDEFEEVWNPGNCEIWVLSKDQLTGTYRLMNEITIGDADIIMPDTMKTVKMRSKGKDYARRRGTMHLQD